MPTEAQRRANQNQDAARSGKRVALWLERDGPEHKALKRIMRERKLSTLVAALRVLLAQHRDG